MSQLSAPMPPMRAAGFDLSSDVVSPEDVESIFGS